MKKALVLLALPLIALTSCDKESLRKYNLTMSENRHVGVEIKALALDFYSDIEATRSFMSITISNRTTKDVTLKFKNTYFTDHDVLQVHLCCCKGHTSFSFSLKAE